MPLSCELRRNDRKYIERKEICGVDEKRFDAYSSTFMDNYGRLPHVEEIPGASSHDAISRDLKLDKDGYTSEESIANATGKKTLREQQQELNNKYTDVEIVLNQTPNGNIRVDENPRPKIYGKPDDGYIEPNLSKNELSMSLGAMCDRISKLYGVNVHLVTTAAIEEMGVYDAIRAKGFVQNGEIFINSDIATVDTPIHELMHMVMGTLKAHDIGLYNKLCDITTKMYNIEKQAVEYPNRTRRDIQEELFVLETARYISGMKSGFEKLEKGDLSEFAYLFNRSIDTMVNGRISANNCDISSVISSGASISDISAMLRSRIFDASNPLIIDERAAALHRINSNKKEELIKRGILKEICE